MLYCHYAERSDALVAALADVLARQLDDPFAPEIVAVHSRGIERWLLQELGTRLGTSPPTPDTGGPEGPGHSGDGIAANIEFPFPGRLVSRVLAEVSGIAPEQDVWESRRLVWPLLELLDDLPDGGVDLGPLRGRVGDADSGRAWSSRRYAVVRHIADLFDSYGVHRPDMIRAWAQGQDIDGAGEPLEAASTWQAALWRQVRDRVGTLSPAERLTDLERLRDDPSLSTLPQRLTLFGSTSLPASHVEVLQALAAPPISAGGRDIHLFVLHPSAALWRAVSRAGIPDARPTRARDRSGEMIEHPLLQSWGRDARELQLVVAGSSPKTIHHSVDQAPQTVLGVLQNDIRANQRPPGQPSMGANDDRAVVPPDDTSMQIHACHGRTRQVEVMRDAILHALADDPDLEPRDILIMCPDIETFAPIIHAVFEAGNQSQEWPGRDHPRQRTTTPDPTGALRVRLADRALRQTNPLLRVVAELLDLVGDRCTASQILDFIGREPVSRRFRFSEHDRERLAGWVEDAHIRWGFDSAHRANYGLGHVRQNTWASGLDRMGLGVAMRDEGHQLFGGVLPYDDIEGDAVALFGRFAESIARLRDVRDGLRAPRTVEDWRQSLQAGAAALTKVGERDHWQQVEFGRVLDDMVDDSRWAEPATSIAPVVPSSVPISLDELRSLLNDRLRGRPRRANHRTGDLTVCTLVPMRSVPHQVVGLLGMDDDAFPRRTRADADNVLERAPKVGDRDRRTEDRQLLLDALLSAGQKLLVTYTGRDERTNERRPPAVPISELLDVIDRSVRRHDGQQVYDQVVREHPLQLFDPRNFVTDGAMGGGTPPAGSGRRGRPWSFDTTALAGARALTATATNSSSVFDTPLPPVHVTEITVRQLRDFVNNPVREFVRQRLDVRLYDVREPLTDSIPVALNNLEAWQIGDGFLTARRSGMDPERWVASARAGGGLPPGKLADSLLATVDDRVAEVLAHAETLTAPFAPPQRLDVDITVAGIHVTGSVENVVGNDLVSVTYSSLKPKHRLSAWVDLLVASLADPDRTFRAVTVGKEKAAVIAPLADDRQTRVDVARRELEVLLDLYIRGMAEPLPLYCATSHAWANRLHTDGDRDRAEADAVKSWEFDRFSPEMLTPDHQLVYSGQRSLAVVLEEVARDDECQAAWAGWSADEQSRFARYAGRLWKPLLEREEVNKLEVRKA